MNYSKWKISERSHEIPAASRAERGKATNRLLAAYRASSRTTASPDSRGDQAAMRSAVNQSRRGHRASVPASSTASGSHGLPGLKSHRIFHGILD